jgi:hypothetical protein
LHATMTRVSGFFSGIPLVTASSFPSHFLNIFSLGGSRKEVIRFVYSRKVDWGNKKLHSKYIHP